MRLIGLIIDSSEMVSCFFFRNSCQNISNVCILVISRFLWQFVFNLITVVVVDSPLITSEVYMLTSENIGRRIVVYILVYFVFL